MPTTKLPIPWRRRQLQRMYVGALTFPPISWPDELAKAESERTQGEQRALKHSDSPARAAA